MEKLLNNRILLVFVLNKLKNLQEESSPIYQACKTACIVLSSQIVALRIKENLIGAELEGSELLLNETLTNKESLDYICLSASANSYFKALTSLSNYPVSF